MYVAYKLIFIKATALASSTKKKYLLDFIRIDITICFMICILFFFTYCHQFVLKNGRKR